MLFRMLLTLMFAFSVVGFSGCGDSSENKPENEASDTDNSGTHDDTTPEDTPTADENPDVERAD